MRLIETEVNPLYQPGEEVQGVELRNSADALELAMELGNKAICYLSQSENPAITNPLVLSVLHMQVRLMNELRDRRSKEDESFVFATVELTNRQRLFEPGSVGREGSILRSILESKIRSS